MYSKLPRNDTPSKREILLSELKAKMENCKDDEERVNAKHNYLLEYFTVDPELRDYILKMHRSLMNK